MLDTLMLIEHRTLPALPEARPAIKKRMLALAALIDAPVDLWPHRTGILPVGCWWLPQAHLVLYGTACRRPLMFDEVRDISRAVGLSGLVVRYDDVAGEQARTTFDVHYGATWYACHLLWIGADGGPSWLLRSSGGGSYVRLSQWGLDLIDEPPFFNAADRIDGLERGAAYLTSYPSWN